MLSLLLFLWSSFTSAASPVPPIAHADCPTGIPAYRGTITVHSGIASDCIVALPGGLILRASGGAAPIGGRAIFRVIGLGIGQQGGISIVVSASRSPFPYASELEPTLRIPALLSVPSGSALWQLDATEGAFHLVRAGILDRATLYRVVLQGVSPWPHASAQVVPTRLPATGHPFTPPLETLGIVVLAGAAFIVTRLARQNRKAERRGIILVALAACAVFVGRSGTLDVAAAPAAPLEKPPVAIASAPLLPAHNAQPTRLVIESLGLDAPIIRIGVVDGSWQVPSYGVGLLQASQPAMLDGTVLTAHDDADGAIFRHLDRLANGATIVLYRGHQSYRYTVQSHRIVRPTDTSALHTGAALTLLTCTPYGVDSERLLVTAALSQGA